MHAMFVCFLLEGGRREAAEEPKSGSKTWGEGGGLQKWALWKNRVGVRICVCFADSASRVSVFSHPCTG